MNLATISVKGLTGQSLSLSERAMAFCRTAKQLEKAGEFELAREALLEFWPEQVKPPVLDGLAPALLIGLIVFIPAGLVAWAPCRALLGMEPIGPGTAVTPAAALLLAAAAAALFNRGMRHYARTGSQRYLSFGHRR